MFIHTSNKLFHSTFWDTSFLSKQLIPVEEKIQMTFLISIASAFGCVTNIGSAFDISYTSLRWVGEFTRRNVPVFYVLKLTLASRV